MKRREESVLVYRLRDSTLAFSECVKQAAGQHECAQEIGRNSRALHCKAVPLSRGINVTGRRYRVDT